MERTFTEAELRRLLWLIGYVTSLRELGNVYDRLAELITDRDMDFSKDVPLIQIARGVWCDAGSYGVGTPDDPYCDRG